MVLAGVPGSVIGDYGRSLVLPVLFAVIDMQDLNAVIVNPVYNQIGGTLDYPFPRTVDVSFTTAIRMCTE
jgi:hypothetical protein